MIKLNNKGITAVELIITFVILSLVVVGMFDVVLNYKDKEQKETIKSSVIDYENKLQKTIQDDLIKGHLVGVELSDSNSTDKISVTFEMNNTKTNQTYNTNLIINLTTGDISYGKSGEEIVYSLPKFTGRGEELTINKDETYIGLIGDDDAFIKVNISLNHSDFETGEFTFSITAPINYPVSE